MTNLSEVYGMFLSRISDYALLSDTITPMELDEQLYGYLKSSINKFYRCKTDLGINKEEDINGEKSFKEILHPFEIEILVKLMLVEYMLPLVLSSEVIKQSLSDKDFKIYSQANQLRELNLLYRLLQKEAKKMITEYSYFGLEEEKM